MPKSTSVSCIYWDLAKRQINNSCPKVHYCTKNVPSIDDIEKHVHIKSPTIAGIKSIERSLAKIGIHLPKDISDIIIHDETPFRSCEEYRDKIVRKKITNEEKGEILFEAIVAVHNQRIKDGYIYGKSFAEIDSSLQFLFLPVEMISFNYASEDYAFVKGAAEALGLRPDNYYIGEAYKLAKQKFCEKYAIFHPYKETIERAILCLPPINQAIYQTIWANKKMRAAITTQVLRNF